MRRTDTDLAQIANHESRITNPIMAASRPLKLSIVIPAYNEEKTVHHVIARLQNVQFPDGVSTEIIVVNDGSTDHTLEILSRMTGITVISQENQGKGAAIITGLRAVTGDYVLIQDADLEYHPEEIPSLLDPVLESQARVVYGSRKLKKNRHSSVLYDLGGIFLSHLTNFLFGSAITDEATGYKLIEMELMQSLELKEKGFDFCPEVTAKILKKRVKIFEVPITYTPRHFTDGKKIRMWDGVIAIWTLFKYRFGLPNIIADVMPTQVKAAPFKEVPERSE